MSIVRRATGLASVLLVLLVQLMLAGPGGACANGPVMDAMRMGSASDAAPAGAMGDMSGMPDHERHAPPDRGTPCPDAGMPSSACATAAACTQVVAIVPAIAFAVARPHAMHTLPAAAAIPSSASLAPETPPPRA